jgi:hypothetical protein
MVQFTTAHAPRPVNRPAWSYPTTIGGWGILTCDMWALGGEGGASPS